MDLFYASINVKFEGAYRHILFTYLIDVYKDLAVSPFFTELNPVFSSKFDERVIYSMVGFFSWSQDFYDKVATFFDILWIQSGVSESNTPFYWRIQNNSQLLNLSGLYWTSVDHIIYYLQIKF